VTIAAVAAPSLVETAGSADPLVRTLELFCELPVEIRVVTAADEVFYCRFDSYAEAAAYATSYNSAKGIYFVLNPFDRKGIQKAVRDVDIKCRRWILIDADPERDADTNATSAEREAALHLAEAIQNYLAELGWPAPVECDSGNGAHLLYPADLPNDEDAKVLVERLLHHLADRFDNEAATVDTSVHNASRITKLYGTMTRKGPASLERPHRLSAITQIPTITRRVTAADLEQIPATQTDDSAADDSYPLPTVINAGKKGKRNDTLYRHACRLRQQGLDKAAILAELKKVNAERCRPPLSDKELETIAGSAAKHEAGHRIAGKSHATKLINLTLSAKAELFVTPEGDPYVTVPVGNHYETFWLGGNGFKAWVAHEYYVRTKAGVSGGAVADASMALQGSARASGTVLPVYTRVAGLADAVYLDLGRPDHQVLHVDATGWRVTTSPPHVRFIRRKGMLALPDPQPGGSLMDLLPTVLNLSGDNLMLVTGWLVQALRGLKPYPTLNFNGEHGTGKTLGSRLVRNIIDPSVAEMSSAPREPRDLMVTARNSHVIGFDNLSEIPPWLSDNLCSLATGAGFRVRANYTDDTEIIFSEARPILFNGIGDLVYRPDLMDRSITVEFETLTDEKRRTEREVYDAFAAAHPFLLGSLASALVQALREPVTLTSMPRMADFVTTEESAAPALGWEAAKFSKVYKANRQQSDDALLDGNPLWSALQRLLDDYGELQDDGSRQVRKSTDELLKLILGYVGDDRDQRKRLPQTGKGLNNAFKRLAPLLRHEGIAIELATKKETKGDHRDKRLTTIRRLKREEQPKLPEVTQEAEPVDEGVAPLAM
jgi:hypothetical protein